MVVLLIMAILLAIAIPTFLGVKGGAQDRATQSNLNTALTNAKAIYGNNQAYGSTGTTFTSGQMVTQLTSSEASLKFVNDATATTSQNTISVAVDGSGNGLILVGYSQNGKSCWGLLTNETTNQTVPTATNDSATINTTAWPNATSAGTWYASWTAAALPNTAGTAGCTADNGSYISGTAGTHYTAWTSNSFPTAAS